MNDEIRLLNLQIEQLKNKLNISEQNIVEIRQRGDIQDTLNEILNISLLHIPLIDQLDKILQIVLGIEWLSLEEKGCIFLVDETEQGLNMVAHYNLGESLLSMCRHIQFGQCLCGIAAQQQKLIFKDCVDVDHANRPEGMQPHGHYNMPIIADGKTLGVLNLYVKHGHKPLQLEKIFLDSCAKAMASIIERKRLEERLHNLSYQDELTGIPNRRYFLNHINNLVKAPEYRDKCFALLFIDLDYFKAINDTFGHETGDKVLVEATRRMQLHLRDTDLVARLGGDEFMVVLEAISSGHIAVQIAEKIIQSISETYNIDGNNMKIGASIGISLFPQHDILPENLLKKADSAVYDAKENRGGVVLFTQPSVSD